MAEKNTERSIWARLLDRYRLIIIEEDSYAEKVNFKLTRLNVLTVIASVCLFVALFVFLIMAYTPLRELIPGYSDAQAKREARRAMETAQVLETELVLREQYIDAVQRVLKGEIGPDSALALKMEPLSQEALADLDLDISPADSSLRAQVAEQERYNLRFDNQESELTIASLSKLVFFTPLRGTVSSGFDIGSEHYGIDVVAPDNETVKSVLDGHVILSHWTSTEGYVIAVQHRDDLISVYKHNSVLLKQTGDIVQAGESIAVVGDSGELSDGPHLHFELWHRGVALDPAQFIIFDG